MRRRVGRGEGCALQSKGQRNAVGGEVVGPRVGKVIPKSHEWAFAGGLVLRDEAHERAHREAPVLDLLHVRHAESATAPLATQKAGPPASCC
jgi:hypothetical protein